MNRTATNSSLEIHDLDASAPETIEGGSEGSGGRRQRVLYRRRTLLNPRARLPGSSVSASTGSNDASVNDL
jgi:hypothetical protein